MADNPFDIFQQPAPPNGVPNMMYQQQPQQHAPMQDQGYGMPQPPTQQPPPPPQQQQYPPQQQVDQFGQPQQVGYSNALVPAAQPSNPYAGMVAPQQQQQQMHQQPVPNGNPAYSQPGMGQAPPDPWGPPPPQQQQHQNPFEQQNQGYGEMPPNHHPAPASPPPVSTPPPASHRPPPMDIVPAPSSGYPGAPPPPRPDETHTPTGAEARNKYSGELSQNAPMGASPLPRADMVQKTGFVLSRISFRTIVMKKWKQSFWVQYGPHTMLWFRSKHDFDDWLNNPYHTQAQRNFIIKLAVNFAHDLYKPNVRGYQVTQCRTKSYGTKLIRQFKLERWMDYGPTIAAAFGSNNPKEVDELREALVACMRNTPLNGGIRATGAVRERANSGDAAEGRGNMTAEGGVGYDSASYAGHQNVGRQASRSVASASELGMDNKGGGFADDSDHYHTTGVMPDAAPAPDLLDFSDPIPQAPPPPQQQQAPWNPQQQQQQQQYYGQAPPAQQQGQYPAQNYPMQQQQMPVHQQQQQMPVQPQQQNFGPPPVQQQAQYQAQAFGY
ncbi:expressed unknown protein [Seminavis robusta]|uniref:Uncharacterized protein n=1 Tax=Seminavis robusta TaxID=568900 RepID=A0A9N8EGM2_9STRA|nr:expressed unknown protein [Seminavis robusta]|eukprot:Sro908_g218820.1 n/a (552) ;mRNA; r:4882-6704